METIQEILSKVMPQEKQLSVHQALATYDHIQLTEEEVSMALLGAKQKKEAAINYAENQKRIEENRKRLTYTEWDYTRTKNFMLYRSEQLFNGKFNVDENNSLVFNWLCKYFSND